MSTQTLQLVGVARPTQGRKFERLTFNHGSGNQESVLVGHSQGVRYCQYEYVAPDRSTHTVNDPENGNTATTWIDYLDAFHGYRMVDGAAFNVTDQRTGSTILVMFSRESATHIEYHMEGKTIWGCTLYLEQYRAP